jgi:hypothetical protein
MWSIRLPLPRFRQTVARELNEIHGTGPRKSFLERRWLVMLEGLQIDSKEAFR